MDETTEIELLDMLYIVKGKIKLIICVTMVFVALSGFISTFIMEPEYETFTILMLGKPADYENTEGINYQDILTNQKLIGTYAEIAKSRTVLDKVIEKLNLGYSSNTLKSKVNISLLNNTEIIKIAVKDNNPQMTAVIANKLSSVFMEEVSRIMKIDNVQVIDTAIVPSTPTGPNIKLNAVIAGILGIMASIFIVFLIEILDNTLKNSVETEKNLNLPVLGMIPEFIQ